MRNPAEGYGRMFPGLPALELEDMRLAALAEELVRSDQAFAPSELPAGYTYFGQFVAHDLTRMRASRNLNRPNLWLDSLFGHPMKKWRHLYRRNTAGDHVFIISRGAILDGTATEELDLPRMKTGVPRIPDERDDFHFIISQLHLAFMLLHNRLSQDLRKAFRSASSEWIFGASRRELCWSYQWLIVHDFLPRICNKSIVELICESPNAMALAVSTSFPSNNQRLSYEFALAGYRFGHSLVRPSYKLNESLWTAPIFHPAGATEWYGDWRGHRKLPIQWSVQWDLFFDFGDSISQKASCMRTGIAPSLGGLPKFAVADDQARKSMINLAERTLRAGEEHGLASGQTIARGILEDVCPKVGLAPFDVVDPGGEDPLWFYVLKEASELGGGFRLGPVGSWIVVATFANLLVADNSTYLHDPDWRPSFPAEGNVLEVRDLVRHSGLPVTREEWARYVGGDKPEWC